MREQALRAQQSIRGGNQHLLRFQEAEVPGQHVIEGTVFLCPLPTDKRQLRLQIGKVEGVIVHNQHVHLLAGGLVLTQQIPEFRPDIQRLFRGNDAQTGIGPRFPGENGLPGPAPAGGAVRPYGDVTGTGSVRLLQQYIYRREQDAFPATKLQQRIHVPITELRLHGRSENHYFGTHLGQQRVGGGRGTDTGAVPGKNGIAHSCLPQTVRPFRYIVPFHDKMTVRFVEGIQDDVETLSREIRQRIPQGTSVNVVHGIDGLETACQRKNVL